MKIRRCPITYEEIPVSEFYSTNGLKKLSRQLKHLNNLPFTPRQLIYEASERSDKMSIQGVQPKLSAILSIKSESFIIVSKQGRYILKPPSQLYPELPENEDVTMRMAKILGIETPLHGMIYNSDQSFTYFIKRFDRVGHSRKIAVEDFAQLSGLSRDTKYNFSMEKLVDLIDKYCTFPLQEKAELFKRVIFNFLVGNEDMHLKNYSLIIRENKVKLAPAYDLLNTTIAIGKSVEEIALPIHGKKNNLTRKDLVDYYGISRLQLSKKMLVLIFNTIQTKKNDLLSLIDCSFLSEPMKERYKNLFISRYKTLFT